MPEYDWSSSAGVSGDTVKTAEAVHRILRLLLVLI